MPPVDRCEQLLADVRAESPEVVLAAALGLLQIGEYGLPVGTYPLLGGKAALRLGRLADAVVLLHHGLRVAEPNTKVWADLLVNRAIACARHGFYLDAIAAGEQFLTLVDSLPADTAAYIPFAHHAVGFAYDRRKEYQKAANHYRRAAELHVDPVQRAISRSDLAYALVLCGNTGGAEQILTGVEDTGDRFARFVLACTMALLKYHQGRHPEALISAEQAEALSMSREEMWADPLSELWYWKSRIVFDLGDARSAATLALRAAITADRLWNLDLRAKANQWLAEILDKRGIQ